MKTKPEIIKHVHYIYQSGLLNFNYVIFKKEKTKKKIIQKQIKRNC